MKKLLTLGIMILCSMLSALAQFSGSGSGTEESPYLIFNVTQLSQLSNFGGQEGVVFRLMKDIDVSEWITDNNPRQGWTPVGVQATPFQGKLLGENHKITGLSITRASESYVGFFGYISGATITDLTIEGNDVTGGSYVGALVGYATNSTLTNCHVKLTGKVSSSSGSYVGGFVGTASYCIINNFSVEANVLSTGSNYVGGFGGSASNGSVLSNGIVNGNVTSSKPYMGGFVGVTETATITDVKVKGNVTGTTHVGGFIGRSDLVDTLTNCTYVGDIIGQNNIGGISGYLSVGSNTAFTSCLSKGKITATGDYVGGIVGVSQGACIADMQNCSHFGDIAGGSYIGGLVGGSLRVEKTEKTEIPLKTYYVRYSSLFLTEPTISNTTSFGSASEAEDRGQTSSSIINNCTAIGNIEGEHYVGGLIGLFISDSYGYRNVLISRYSGSYNYLFELINGSYYYANHYWYSGNRTFFHRSIFSINITLSNSYYSGNIDGKENVGALIGQASNGTINKNYAMANVIAENNVGGLIGQANGATIQSNIANNPTLSASQAAVGRIYGTQEDCTIGALGSTQGNRALVTTKVVKSGILQEVTDDLQNGTSIGAGALKLKATYGALGWNYDTDWEQLETECYPYKKYQAAPPTITSKLESQATTISGKSTDGGTVYLYYKDKEPVSCVCDGNDWSFTTEPLQSGAQVQVYADAEGMTPSYFSTTNVSYPGLGTETAPYLIYTAEDLQGVNKSGYYKVMNDIDLTSWINENSPVEGWPAIGLNGSEAVYIDGDYHKIRGLWTNTTKDFNGLFSSFLVGQIKNLTVEVATGKKVKGGDYTGILIGRMANAKIVNCVVKGDVEGTLHVGGVAGALDNTELSTLTYSGNVTSATADAYAGGITGMVTGGSMKVCQAEGTVAGTLFVGGLAGFASQAELDGLTFSGSLSSSTAEASVGGLVGKTETCMLTEGNAMPAITTMGSTAYVGGAIGYADGGEITKSVASDNITASGTQNYVGGLVGYSDAAITQSNANGSVTATGENSYAGGLIGYATGSVANSYSTANVKGTLYTAGLVANTFSTIDKCYAKGNVTGQFHGGGIVANMDGGGAATTNCAAMNSTLSLTAQTAWACRVIGGYGNGCADPDESNYALSTMQVSLNGIPTKKYDDIMEGMSKTQAELMQAATYIGMGWDMSNTWSIDDGEVYPYLLWEVGANPVAEIILDNTALLIAVDKTATIKATVLPLSANNKRLNWATDNSSVAVVEDGVVTAIGEGTAKITASSTDGSNVTATCNVTVTANKDAAIAELQARIDNAQELYDNSTEGEEIGQYADGSRTALLAVIENVSGQISSTMSDETLAECLAAINEAIATFESRKVSGGDDTDITQMDNVVYIEPQEAAAGAVLTLSVKMKNTVNAESFGFDLYLPEGVTVATDEDGFVLAELSTERTNEKKTNHFDAEFKQDGSLNVQAYSSRGYTISGNDGEVALVTVHISKDMEPGDYPIILKNIAIADENSITYRENYVKTTLTISAYTPGDANNDGFIDVGDLTAISHYILERPDASFNAKAGDANNDGSIDVGDLTAVSHLILWGTIQRPNSARGMKTQIVDPQ